MSAQEERPPRGGSWLGNARMHEQRRQDCLREQLAAEKRGDQELAATWRAHAEANTSERDRVQREEERRATNRSLASRRRYY